jgi:hypothetical protein
MGTLGCGEIVPIWEDETPSDVWIRPVALIYGFRRAEIPRSASQIFNLRPCRFSRHMLLW